MCVSKSLCVRARVIIAHKVTCETSHKVTCGACQLASLCVHVEMGSLAINLKPTDTVVWHPSIKLGGGGDSRPDVGPTKVSSCWQP